ncbi:MAG: hypothetical protein Q7T76_14030 [Ferruginibacter sp.]|nr:hypothetical protein [Ferruginibacter sp.]
MKQIIQKSIFLFAVMAALVSFTPLGGEGFEIYLNNKVVLQQFGKDMDQLKSLKLTHAFADDNLVVKYHHCGKVSKNRMIAIKDANNKTLKEWRFADVGTPFSAMQCKVKDIISLSKKDVTELRLFYTSSELPAGRQLTSIVVESSNLAVR